jgi:hypothetical protein
MFGVGSVAFMEPLDDKPCCATPVDKKITEYGVRRDG